MTDELTTMDALAQMSFLIQGELDRRADQRGFSLIQTRLLGVLRDREPTINELAAALRLDKSSVSGLADRAARRGLVERRPSTTDRRSVRVALTDEGRAKVDEFAAQFEQDLSDLLEPLAEPERQTLTTLISRVLISHANSRGIDLLTTRDVRGVH